MNESAKTGLWVDCTQFQANRSKVSAEELAKFAGQVLAWTLDGTRILASGRDELDVARKLQDAGIDISQVVFDNIPDSDTILG